MTQAKVTTGNHDPSINQRLPRQIRPVFANRPEDGFVSSKQKIRRRAQKYP
jgi:hypothetical protein